MAHEMFVLLLLGWGPSWKGKSSEIFPFSCSPAFLHTPSEAVRTFLVAAHLAQFWGDSTTLPGEFQNSLGWKRPLKIIWSIHLLKPGLTTYSQNRLLRAVSSWVLTISKDRNPMPCMGNVFQHLTKLTKNFFSTPNWKFSWKSSSFHPASPSSPTLWHSWRQHEDSPSAFSTPSWSQLLLHYVLQPPAITELTQQWEPWSCMSELSLSTLLTVRSDMCRAKETSHIALMCWRCSPLCF